jgi:Zn ribbon nucleic-acid-binding protein
MSPARISIGEAESRHSDLVKGKEWAGNHASYKYQCNRHGVYFQSFNAHNRGSACPTCAREQATSKTRLTTREMERRHPELIKGQTPKGVDRKYKYRCKEHGIYLQSFSHHDRGEGCPACGGTARQTSAQIIKRIEKSIPTIKVIGIPYSMRSKVFLRCESCAHEWLATPDNLITSDGIQKRGCPKCSGRLRRTPNEIAERIKKAHPMVRVVALPNGTQRKVPLFCKVCGHEWSSRPCTLVRANGAPRSGCRKCGFRATGTRLKLSSSEIVRRIKQAHPTITVMGTPDGTRGRRDLSHAEIFCRCRLIFIFPLLAFLLSSKVSNTIIRSKRGVE